MGRASNGTYTLPSNDSSPAAPRNVIKSADFNEITADIEAALTDSLSRSGDGAMLANLDMGGFDLTNTGETYLTASQNLAEVNPASALGNLGAGAAGISVFQQTTAAAIRDFLDVVPGTDVQAQSAILQSLANETLTAGDLLYAADATTVANLPIGTDGQVLGVSAGVLAWQDGGTGDMLEATYDPQAIGADAFDRANHTGTQDADTITSFSVWSNDVFRTLKERATDVAYSGDFDVDPTGANDSLSGLQAMFDEQDARAEIAPGTFEITDTLLYTRGASGFNGRGKIIEGSGKRRTVLRNSTTADPLINFGDALNDLDGLDGFLGRMSLEGNALSTAGVEILGGDDDGLTQASRGVILQALRVTGIGAGPAYRFSAWKGRMDACETQGSLRGIVIGNQVYSFLATGFYNIDAVNEAIFAEDALAGSKSNSIAFIGSVLQNCGASGQMAYIGGGANWHFGNTYMEVPAVGCTAAWRLRPSVRNANIKGVNYSTGGGPTIDLVETEAVATHLEDLSIYGNVASYVKILGTSRRVIIDQVDQPSGTVTTPINEASATTPVIHARGLPTVASRSPSPLLIGNNSLSIIDRSAGSPEGVITAVPGSIVGVRSGADSGVWGKATGIGNTGWVKMT